MKTPLLTLLLLPLLAAFSPCASSQDFPHNSRLYLAGGVTTYWINGYNPGSQPLFPKDTTEVFGGGIYGQQPGLSLKAIYMIDTGRIYRLTLGGDYFFVSGGQRIEEEFFSLTARHTLNIMAISGGFEYAFATIPLANARVYAGVEGRFSFLENIRFESRLFYKDFDSLVVRNREAKESAMRFGTTLRLGVEGEIFDPAYVNISVAYNAINMFNRDDNRGELLTPQNFAEQKESVVGNLFFSFWLQYRL